MNSDIRISRAGIADARKWSATGNLASLSILLTTVVLTGCDSGSFGSDVGSQESFSPVAEAVIVGHRNDRSGGSVSTTVRSGAEVTIAGGSSYGVDGPIVDFAWSAVNSEAQALESAGELIVRNTTARSFTAPNVTATTTYEFQLTVTDSEGDTDSAEVSVTVQPAIDPDRFLQYLTQPDRFKVVAGTSEPIVVDLAFTVSAQLRVTYEDRAQVTQTWLSEAETRSSSWISGIGSDSSDPNYFGNPSMLFDTPSVDLDDVNAEFLNLPADDPNRQKMLDAFKLSDASTVVDVIVRLDFSPVGAGDPTQVDLYVQTVSGNPIAMTDAGNLEPVLAIPLTQFAVQAVAPESVPPESARTADLYYLAVDPQNERLTLNQWLLRNCFTTNVQNQYGSDAHAVYVNNFDLGFGRDMYLKRGDSCSNNELVDGDIAYVVINYPTLLAAAKRIDPIIAVAMEYTAHPQDPLQERYAKFFVFAPDDAGDMIRVTSANFDGRGERFVPGVCSSCHGGRPVAVDALATEYPDFGKIGATFMPFDVDSFLFTGPPGDAQKDPALPPPDQPFLSDIDRNILETYTRSAQEGEFRALNAAALSTYNPADQFAPVRNLVHGWYGNSPMDPTSNDLTGDFMSDTVPPGWTDDTAVDAAGMPVIPVAGVPSPSEVYLNVVAQHCRGCHTQQQTEDSMSGAIGQRHPTFDSYEDFISSAVLTEERVYREGQMPLARLTMDRFWVDFDGGNSASDVLAAHLDEYEPPSEPRQLLGTPVARISLTLPETRVCESGETIQVMRGDQVKLNGFSSSYADEFVWEIIPPANSTSISFGRDTVESGFETDTFGTWDVSLVVASSSDLSSAPATCRIEVQNLLPMAPQVTVASIDEGETTQAINVSNVLVSAAGTAVFGDRPETIFIGGLAENGTVNVSNNNSANPTFTFTSNALASQGSGEVSYSITDTDGDVAQGLMVVNIAELGRPMAANDMEMVNATSTVVPVTDVRFDVVDDNDSKGGTGMVEITAVNGSSTFPVTVRNSAMVAKGTVSRSADLQALLFTPLLGQTTFNEAALEFDYTITDANPIEPQESTATVSVTISPTIRFSGAAPTIQAAVASCAGAGCHGAGQPVPNWGSYNTVTGTSTFQGAANNGPRINPPGSAASSIFLRVPITGKHLNNNNHSGGANLLDPGDTSVTSNYNVILRWIEEGANNN